MECEELYLAVAELLNVDKDIIEVISPNVGEDIGLSSDNIHYGYYFEFPKYDELDDDIKKEIEKYDIKHKIPFGQTICFDDSVLGNTKADPFGWKNDYEQELFILNQQTTKLEIRDTINNLKDKINQCDDEIIKKSLILASYSIIDGFVKSFIFDQINKYNLTEINETTMDIFNEILLNKLENTTGRKQIYKKLNKSELPNIPRYNPLRNLLAHNFSMVSINNNMITYEDKSHNIQEYSIDNLFKDFENFITNL
ncbi:MAG: hypothetical protein ACI4U5_04840 [Bacilli bacterium]